MKLRIKRRLMPSCYGAKLVFFVIIWNILSAILIGFLKFPKSIIYIGDILNVWLFMNAIYKEGHKSKYSINYPIIFMVIFTLIGIIGSLVSGNSLILMIWGLRQNARYFLFFYSCVVFLNENDLKILIKIIEKIFWISIPLCTYEAFFVHYSSTTIVGDMVGGIYYGMSGVNAPLNVILIIYVSYVLLEFFESRCKLNFMVLTLAAALYMSALAELKVFLIEVIIIVAYAMIKSGINFKTIIIVVLGILFFGFVLEFFVEVNSNGREYYTLDFLTINGMVEYATSTSGYDGVGDLNRFTAIQQLNHMFFKNDIFGFLFGNGIGSGEFSKGFDILTSQFYKQYSYLHYQYFTSSFIFIETGLLGLISYIMIFVSSLFVGFKKNVIIKFKKLHEILVIMTLLLIIYNTSLRNEYCAYILYAMLAIPHIKQKSIKNIVVKRGENT